jgi:tubulin-folding cofactor B
MAFQPTPMDISVIITNAALGKPGNSEPRFLTERRITPTWTVMQVKAKLETMTGIPPGSQRLRVKVPGRPDQWAEGDDRLIGDWGLVKGSEIEVCLFYSLSCCFFPRNFAVVALSILKTTIEWGQN